MTQKIESRTQYRWQTWWSIVGPRLTKAEFRLRDNIVLAPVDDETFQRMKDYRAPAPTIGASSDSFVAHYPPRDVVQSRHRLQIDVPATDEDEAVEAASDIAARLLLSLSLVVPDGNYHAEMRKYRRADQDQEASGWSQTIRITPLTEPDYLQKADIDGIHKLLHAIEEDATAELAYEHLLSAWQLQSTAGSKPLDRSILQHYVLCFEAVVNSVMAGLRKERADKIRLEERTYAKEFAESLSKRADKPEAIRQASAKLREISLSNTIPSFDIAAKTLGLPTDIAESAKELYRFRSSSLSHPRRPDQKKLQNWLRSGSKSVEICPADKIARAFFVGYCESSSESS